MSIITDVLKEVKRQSNSFSSKRELLNNNWVKFNEQGYFDEKTTLIFKSDGVLIVSKSGIIENESWEFLNENTISVTENSVTYLYRVYKYSEGILILNRDSTDFAITLIAENKMHEIGQSLLDYLSKGFIENKQEEKKTIAKTLPPTKEEKAARKEMLEEKQSENTKVIAIAGLVIAFIIIVLMLSS